MEYQEEYKNYIDENFGEINIFGQSFTASEILEIIDPIAYEDSYRTWLQDELERNIYDFITNGPHPIAVLLKQITNDYDNNNHRLQLLRTLWELIVNFIFAIVISTCREKSLSLNKIKLMENGSEKQLKFSNIFDEKISQKLLIITSIHSSFKNELNVNFIDDDCINILKELNQHRNAIQHGSALNEFSAKTLFDDLYEKFKLLLYKIKVLRDYHIFKYKGNEDKITLIKIRSFIGISPSNNNLEVTEVQIQNLSKYLNTKNLFVNFDSEILPLSPFLVADSSDQNKILILMKRTGAKLKFECNNAINEDKIDNYEHSINPIKSLFI